VVFVKLKFKGFKRIRLIQDKSATIQNVPPPYPSPAEGAALTKPFPNGYHKQGFT
jgi:hypothetical protein